MKNLTLLALVVFLTPICSHASLHGQNVGAEISSAEFSNAWKLDRTPIVLADGTLLKPAQNSALRSSLLSFLKPYMMGPQGGKSETARHYYAVDLKSVAQNESYSQDPKKLIPVSAAKNLAVKGFFLARDYERSSHDRDLYILPHIVEYSFGLIPHSLDYDNYLVTAVWASRVRQASRTFSDSLDHMSGDLSEQMKDLVLNRKTTRSSYLNDGYQVSSLPSGNAVQWVFPDKYALGIFKTLDRHSKLMAGPYYCEDKARHEVKAEWGGLVERGLQGTIFKGAGLAFADLTRPNDEDDLFVGFYSDDAMVKLYENDLKTKSVDLEDLVSSKHNRDQDDLVGFVKVPAKLLNQPCARFVYVGLDANAPKQPKLDYAVLFQVNDGSCSE